MSANKTMSDEARRLRNEYYRKYRQTHPEKVREIQRKWREKNPEKIKEQSCRYWERKAEKMRETESGKE